MSEMTFQIRGRFISLRVKLLVGFTLLFTVVFAVAFWWFFNFATRMAIGRIQEDLVDTLMAASAGVNEAELVALYEEGEPNADGFSDDPRYIRQLDWLDVVHDIEPRAWPYTYVEGEEQNEIVFIGDLWARYDPSKAAAFKESLISTGFLYGGLSELTFRTDENGEFTTYTDKWGRWVSAYVPVVNAQGERVGGIGIDFEADYVDQVQQGIRDRVFIAFAITYAALFVLVYLFSGAFSRPILALTRIAERIGEGDYEQDLSGLTRERLPDEIDTLANVFDIMVGKVYQREQRLRERVEELQIIVDRSKRDEQVSEIVETDFFQDLQAKASKMRRRSRKKD